MKEWLTHVVHVAARALLPLVVAALLGALATLGLLDPRAVLDAQCALGDGKACALRLSPSPRTPSLSPGSSLAGP